MTQKFNFFLGRSSSGFESVAYGPFIELFNDILHKQPELQDSLPVEIGRLVPGFKADGEKIPHADKLAAKGYLFAQVHRFFSKFSEDEPIIVIVEDLHSADQGTRELFSYLVRHRGNLPILFAATYRKEDVDPVSELFWELQEHSVEVFELAPLSYEEHVNLLHQNVNNAVIGADITAHIYHLAEGNPLYAVELVRHYTDEGLPDPTEPREGSGIIPNTPMLEKIPPSIRNMVEQILEKLSPAVHHLLYIAAVIGKQVPYELLAFIWSGGNKDEEGGLFNALEEAIRASLLEEHGLDYTFRHTLVKETIYATISEPRRQILHKQIADRLLDLSAETSDEPVEKIAFHYLGAGELLDGAIYLKRAGKRAEDTYAHENALQRYWDAYKVLDKLEKDGADRQKCELLKQIGDVYRACGQLKNSYDAYEEAISFAEKLSIENPDRMELYRKMALVAILQTDIDRSEKYLEKPEQTNRLNAMSTSTAKLDKTLVVDAVQERVMIFHSK